MSEINMYMLEAKEAEFERKNLDEKCKRCNIILSKRQKVWCQVPALCGKSKLTSIVVS